MAGSKDKLTPRQEAAIVALLSSRNVEEAAKASNNPVRTLYRWLKDPTFDAAYRKAQRVWFRQAVGRLQQAANPAVAALIKLAMDPTVPPTARARAAYCILTLSIRAFENDELDERLTALERAEEMRNQNKR